MIEPTQKLLHMVFCFAVDLVRADSLGKLTSDAHVDVYHLTNSRSIMRLNKASECAWHTPTAVLNARFIQFGALLSAASRRHA
jgi:hypothetical protein